ncbi:uncharacterized protein LOC142625334 [Castanea sativa]|uniref:uncharacterized protein LOC142625334 n=1 Tax=Castanea sativa TaxID=21020 RepID=UPI003F64D124
MDFAYQGKNPPTKLVAMAQASNAALTNNQDPWLADSGTSDHLTANLGNLSVQSQYKGLEQITVGNGQTLPINHIGNASPSTKYHNFVLKNVLHVPRIAMNLLFVHKFCLDNNCSCHFDAHELKIQDVPTGRILYKGLNENGFVVLPEVNPTTHVSSSTPSPSHHPSLLTSPTLIPGSLPSSSQSPTSSSFPASPLVESLPSTTVTSMPVSVLAQNIHPMITRSKDGIFKPKALAVSVSKLASKPQIDYTFTEPPTYKIASQFPLWCSAMDEEHGKYLVFLLVYVDDIVLTGNCLSFLQSLIQQLSYEFELKDLGNLHYFLGLQITHTSKGLFLNQSKYAQDLLLKHNMLSAKAAKIPCASNLVLAEGSLLANPHVYRSMVGSLHYLTFTRPDLSFAIHQKQDTVSHSSTKSKYRALAIAAAELCWIRQVLRDIGIFLSFPPKLWCDNISALAIASNPVFHARTKHVEVDYHFVRERVLRCDLQVCYIATGDQLADIFTKSLSFSCFQFLRSKTMVSLDLLVLRDDVSGTSESTNKEDKVHTVH